MMLNVIALLFFVTSINSSEDLYELITTQPTSSTTPLPSDYEEFLGEDADIANFPYQVSLRFTYTRKHFCGGAILNASFILTAAHCMFDSNYNVLHSHELHIIAGQSQLKLGSQVVLRFPNKIILHPGFKFGTAYEHNIALIKLEEVLPFTKLIKPILLNVVPIVDNLKCTVSGWGTMYQGPSASMRRRRTSETLKKDNLRESVTRKTCHNASVLPAELTQFVGNGSFCTETMRDEADDPTSNLCEVPDDSGGPLVCNGVLAGIVSIGTNCTLMGHIAIYTNIQEHLEWIMGSGYNPGSSPRHKPIFDKRKSGRRGSAPKVFCNKYIYLVIVVAIKF